MCSFQVIRNLVVSILLLLLCLPVLASSPGGRDGNLDEPRTRQHTGEDGDIAFLRAKAYYDMYSTAGDRAQAAGNPSQAKKPSASGAAPQGRFLPLYSAPVRPVDPDERLRTSKLLQLDAKQVEVSGFSLLGPGPSGAAGSEWRTIGPANFAGRVAALAVDPRNPELIYRGSAGGGVWKTMDGGRHWLPLTDDLGNLSVGAIALAPSNPDIVYVGTGEGSLAVDGIGGIGLIRSDRAGAPGSWRLPNKVVASQFFALSVHPAEPDEILATTSAGILKSTDGGGTWTVTLGGFTATSLVRSPGAPQQVLASVWDIERGQNSTFRGFVYRSVDGGDSWSEVGGPGHKPFSNDTGRIEIAASPSDARVVYLLAASASGDVRQQSDILKCPKDKVDQAGFYRSADGGLTWTKAANPISGNCKGGFESILGAQGWYANTLLVDRSNASVVYAGGLEVWKSSDGAKTWTKKTRWDLQMDDPHYAHADVHALVWAGDSLLIGDDGGLSRSTASLSSLATLDAGIPTRQYYSIAVTPGAPDLTIGGAQDNGTNLRQGNSDTYAEVIGGDGFGTAIDQRTPSRLYGTLYSARVFLSTNSGQTFNDITPKYDDDENRPFITPLTMDPTNSMVLYTGTNHLWKTTDGGTSWSRTSSTDLGDGSDRGYITKIAVSKTDPEVILTASGSGNVNESLDGGRSWLPVHGLPIGKYASHVEFDTHSKLTFYVAFTGGASDGRLFKTTDGGQTFNRIDSGRLSEYPIHVLRVSPADSEILFAGTDVGIYRSVDGGVHWNPLFGRGLPAVSVWDIAFLPDQSLIRIATHGRGFYEATLAAAE